MSGKIIIAPIIVDGYCRVSTDEQEENTSLDEQEASIRAFCAERGFIVGRIHREVVSGFSYRERKELCVMRERYREGIIQGVAIRTLDRLSRNQTHIAVLMEEMEHHKIRLYGVKEPIDNTAMGKFVIAAFALVAEMEREEYEKILNWCKKVKNEREELTYSQKRDFLRLIGATILVERLEKRGAEIAWDIKVRLPKVEEVI